MANRKHYPHRYELSINDGLAMRRTYKCGRIAFGNFEYWKSLEWFNFPMGIRVEKVQLVRDDGLMMSFEAVKKS